MLCYDQKSEVLRHELLYLSFQFVGNNVIDWEVSHTREMHNECNAECYV